MAINARIEGTSVMPDGTVRLTLGPWDDDPPGQQVLYVLNPPDPPEQMESVIGTHIWGGSGFIMIGEKEWAKREGYLDIRLNEEATR